MEDDIRQLAATAIANPAYEWGILIACSIIAGATSLAIAGRDRKFLDRTHLLLIGLVGSLLGLGGCAFTADLGGGVGGYEYRLVAIAVGMGVMGRLGEYAITKKTASILGLDLSLDDVRRECGVCRDEDEHETRDPTKGT